MINRNADDNEQTTRYLRITIALSGKRVSNLEKYARHRKMTPTELVTTIVCHILDDNLIDAVIDDEGNHIDGPSN